VCALLWSCVYAQTPAPEAKPEPKTEAKAPAKPEPKAENDNVRWDSIPSIEIIGWLPRSNPKLREGKQGTGFGDLNFSSKTIPVPGALVSIPVSKSDVLRFAYFQTKGSLTGPVTVNTNLYGGTFVAGDSLTSKYTTQAAKISFESLFYPFPTEGAKLRFKSLWEVQYANVKSTFDSTGKDTSGNATTNSSKGSDYMVLPSLGMAMTYAASSRVHLDIRGSGFWLPHRANLGDAEATSSFRMGPFDLVIGGRFYHFRTSPKKVQYVSATMPGAFVGLRWYFR